MKQSFCLAIALSLLLSGPPLGAADSFRLPEFSQRGQAAWINSGPLTVSELLGQVLLIDIWTFECWNCYRSFPWLNALEQQLQDQPFRVVGIHSPEFEHEHDRDRVAAKVDEFGLQHAVMLDNDFGYWRALGNRYWPTFYLVDKRGRVRFVHSGETHAGDARARLIEQQVEQLLAE